MAFHCMDCLKESMVSGKTGKRNEPQCGACWGDLFWGTRDDFMRLVAKTSKKKLDDMVGTMIRKCLSTCRN